MNCQFCVHYKTWRENQAPLGSGCYWPETFEECEAPFESEEMLERVMRASGKGCPHFVERIVRGKCRWCKRPIEIPESRALYDSEEFLVCSPACLRAIERTYDSEE